jgi:hypothetical protein
MSRQAPLTETFAREILEKADQLVYLGIAAIRETTAHAAWRAYGVSTVQDHSRGPGIRGTNEQVTFPPLPCDRYPASGHPPPDPLAEKLHRDWRHISFARLLRTQALGTPGLLPRAASSPPAAAGSAELALRHYRTARPPTRARSAGNGSAGTGTRA